MTVWETLGIGRTGDRAVIRRAYAVRLKRTNPEDDPDGFRDLRAAYEAALHYADVMARTPDADEDEADGLGLEKEGGDDEAAPFTVVVRDAPAPQEAAVPVVSPDRADSPDFAGLRTRLETLLRLGGEDDDEARIAALKAVLDAPQLDHLETRQQIESWLLHLLTASRPRSDALIGMARQYFGWTEHGVDRRRGSVDVVLQKRLLQRETDVTFLRRIARPDNEHHRAFRILSRPPQPETLQIRLFPPVKPSEIHALLSRIRLYQPLLESDLHPDAVAVWTSG